MVFKKSDIIQPKFDVMFFVSFYMMYTNQKNYILIAACNIIAVLLLLSWYLNVCLDFPGIWNIADRSVFEFFNQRLYPVSGFTWLVAVTNVRIFDLAAMLAMGLVFACYFLKETPEGRHRLFCVFLFMVLFAVAVKLLCNLIPFDRRSPTKEFAGINLVSKLVSFPLKVKDGSNSCFPGDHGVMLLIFSFVMLRYLGVRAFTAAMAVFAVFSLPRIMSGAHWFSDVAVGSVSVTLIACSWVMLTTCSDRVVAFLEQKVPHDWRIFSFGRGK